MSSKIAFIGGSGIYQLDGVQIIKRHKISTPYGDPSDEILEAEVSGAKCYFLPRHGADHRFLPHEVNYRANIFALKTLGVEYVVSISAVGSLKEELAPTTFVLVDQFIDWTRGQRKKTFFGEGIVAHVSNADPICRPLRDVLEDSCKAVGVKHSVGGAYICIEGPGFSTRAESHLYKGFGASVIGMTNVPEAYLAKEAGMAYATMAMVTDFDAWLDEHCTVEEIMKVMKTNNQNAQKVLLDLIPKLSANLPKFEKDNTFAIMTPKEKMSNQNLKVLEVLLK